MFDYDAKYTEYLNFFNESLTRRLKTLSPDAPSVIKDAMEYATVGGGKRVRPILCYATSEMLGGNLQMTEEFALAIEFIHSYSLVHDDLPAMDNDDYRRGKLATHKQFGEAIGILAGDALLNYAFETMLSKEIDYYDIRAMRLVAKASGYNGIIGGQVLDLQNEKNDNATEKDLYSTYLNKTAKLISLPVEVASTLCGEKHLEELSEYGYHLGILFQISDDIMDVEGTLEELGKTPHKDDKVDKLTSVKLFGLQGAKDLAFKHYSAAKKIIERIDGVGFMNSFTDKLYFRKS